MKLGRLNHVGVATPDIAAAIAFWRGVMGAADVTEPFDMPEQGVRVCFVNTPEGGTQIELLAPLSEASPLTSFLARNPQGGMHHLCYEVDDIRAARDRLAESGARILGDGEPKIGAHDKPVLFLHPKDFCGTLVELEQV